MTASSALLEVDRLRVSISTRDGEIVPVDGVSLSVGPGETVGIVGESGCGKSTLLRAIAGVLPRGASVAGGEIRIDGKAIPPGRHPNEVGMIFQDPMTALNPVMKVGDLIAEVPRKRDGLSRRAARELAVGLMREVGIPEPEKRMDWFPHQLSGGLRQRVLIAAALSGSPRVLLCDEPTTALDVTVQAQLIRLLKRLSRERRLGILYVTHDLPLLNTVCDRIEVMYAGQIIEQGSTSEVLLDPMHPYTYGLLTAAPRIGGSSEPLTAIPGHPPRLAPGLSGCRFSERCPHRRTECGTAEGLGEDTALHMTACVRADELHPLRAGDAS